MFRGCPPDGERSAAAFVGGWYLTGDLARRDADGRHWFVGRADDVIKSAGHLVGPVEAESVRMEHMAVEAGREGGFGGGPGAAGPAAGPRGVHSRGTAPGTGLLRRVSIRHSRSGTGRGGRTTRSDVEHAETAPTPRARYAVRPATVPRPRRGPRHAARQRRDESRTGGGRARSRARAACRPRRGHRPGSLPEQLGPTPSRDSREGGGWFRNNRYPASPTVSMALASAFGPVPRPGGRPFGDAVCRAVSGRVCHQNSHDVASTFLMFLSRWSGGGPGPGPRRR